MVVEIEPDLPHAHCDACYDRNCTVSPQPGNACSLVNCDIVCGARFHRCKADEHRLLCPNARTECVNAIYGCPIDIQRRHICTHLEVCPASVVNCTMEWNRWPVYASERQPQQPLQLAPDNYNQLDIALALRDQRMLTKSMKASKRTRQILTNALNRRHPAVPLSAQLTSSDVLDVEEEQRELDHLLQVMQDEKEAADRERARTPPGLQRSICNELYRQGPESNGVDGAGGAADQPYFPLPRDPFIHCSHCVRRKERMERIMASHDAMLPPEERKEAIRVMEEDSSGPSCVDGHHTPPLEQHNGLAHDTEACSSGLHHHDGREDSFLRGDFIEHPDDIIPASLNSTFSSEDSDLPTPAVFVTQSTTGDVSAAPTRGHSKPIIIQPPAVASSSGNVDKSHRLSCSSNGSLDSRHSLSLDLSLESITRYQAKPDSMYTFLCAQEFRRDEYPYHFQNVHSDIHGSLNGWMEQRCPLAPYGCTFSQRRLYPGIEGAHIIHSENLESFGLCLEAIGERGKPNTEELHAHSLEDSEACKSATLETTPSMEPTNNSKQPNVLAETSDNIHAISDVAPRNGSRESGKNGLNVSGNDGKHDALESIQKSSTDSLKCNGFNSTESNSGMKAEENETNGSTVSMAIEDSEIGVRINGNRCDSEKLDQSGVETDSCNSVCQGNQDAKLRNVEDGAEVSQRFEDTGRPNDEMDRRSSSHPAGNSGVDHLGRLPLELLRYLVTFLDSFTINHVAMTSKLLRQVCCSLLEERGMVVLQWEKHRGHWETTMKVWHFSTAFTPVRSWGFQDNPPIAEHLKRCPFNDRNVATGPVKVMGHDPAPVKLEAPKPRWMPGFTPGWMYEDLKLD